MLQLTLLGACGAWLLPQPCSQCPGTASVHGDNPNSRCGCPGYLQEPHPSLLAVGAVHRSCDCKTESIEFHGPAAFCVIPLGYSELLAAGSGTSLAWGNPRAGAAHFPFARTPGHILNFLISGCIPHEHSSSSAECPCMDGGLPPSKPWATSSGFYCCFVFTY